MFCVHSDFGQRLNGPCPAGHSLLLHAEDTCALGNRVRSDHLRPVVCMQCYFSQEGLKPLNPEGASAEGSFTNIVMSGQDVFRFAVRAVPAVSSLLLCLHLADTAAMRCSCPASRPVPTVHATQSISITLTVTVQVRQVLFSH